MNSKNIDTPPSTSASVAYHIITNPHPPNSFSSTTPHPLPAARTPMARPTFNSLMAPDERTPRRKPVMDHDGVAKNVIEYLGNQSQWRIAETEMVLPPMPAEGTFGPMNGVERRADVMAWNPRDQEFIIFECKASWSDFHRDRKFFDYRKWCNLFAFAVPEELAAAARLRMEDVPGWYDGVGLLVIPNDYGHRRMVLKPTHREWDKGDYQKMVERWAMSCHNRLIGTRMEIAQLKHEAKNLRSDLRQAGPPQYGRQS